MLVLIAGAMGEEEAYAAYSTTELPYEDSVFFVHHENIPT